MSKLTLEVLEHLYRTGYGATVAYRQPEWMAGELVNGPNASTVAARVLRRCHR